MLKKGLLYINSSKKNLFITLTDVNRKVLFSSSSGKLRESGKKNRRYKKSPGTLIRLAEALAEKILKKNILSINVILKITPKITIKNFLRELLARGIYIYVIRIKIPYTFSKVRDKKLRRI